MELLISAHYSLLRMLSAKNHDIDVICNCSKYYNQLKNVRNLINFYNHLIFDFETH
jgi:hypothetical protein